MTSCSCCLTITNNWHQFHIVLGMQHFLFIAAIIDGGHAESGQSIASPRVLRGFDPFQLRRCGGLCLLQSALRPVISTPNTLTLSG